MIHYPADYFDPFGDEPRFAKCDRCEKTCDVGDLHKIGNPGCYEWLCDDCLEKSVLAETWSEPEEE